MAVATDTGIGQRIAAARKRNGQTREELAVAAHRSVDSIKFYESGRICPPIPVLARVAEALGVSLSELIDGAAT